MGEAQVSTAVSEPMPYRVAYSGNQKGTKKVAGTDITNKTSYDIGF